MPRVSDVPNIADDAESIAAFFGNVCAARGTTLAINAPVVSANGTGTQWEELCGACQVMPLALSCLSLDCFANANAQTASHTTMLLHAACI